MHACYLPPDDDGMVLNFEVASMHEKYMHTPRYT